MNWPFLFEKKNKNPAAGFQLRFFSVHKIMYISPNPGCDFYIFCGVSKKQSSEDARILTIFLFINYPQCSRSTNEAPGVYECVRQSGVTKQQARTQPWGSIIENTQPQTHMPAHPPTLTSSLKASSNIPADIRVSLSIMNKPSIVLLGPVWHMNT